MTEQPPGDTVHVVVHPGSGTVARLGAGVMVVLDGGADEVRGKLLDVLEEAAAGSGTPGRMVARKLVALLSQNDPESVPAFGACAPTERGWSVILHQGVALHVDSAAGPTHLSGHDAATWVDRIIPMGFTALHLLADGEEVGPVDHRFRFQGGVIPGGGATILPAEGAALQAQGATPVEDAETTVPPAEAPQPHPAPSAQAIEQHAESIEPTEPADAEPAATEPPPAEPAPAQPAQDPTPVQAAPPPAEAAPPPAEAAPPPAQAAAPEAAPLPSRTPQEPPAGPAPTPLFANPAANPGAVPAAPGLVDDDEPPTLIQAPERPDDPLLKASQPGAIPEGDVPFESVPLIDVGAEARRDPLPVLTADTPKEEVEDGEAPLVYGVLSPTGYFNHPDALYCAVTGVSMLHRTHVLVQRPRPPLGVIVADDGSTFTLNKDYVVGREPERDPKVEADSARPLKLSDAERSLSRVHAELRLMDWDVYVVDRASANGTYVLPRGGQQWKRLVADTPEKIVPGTRVAFGKRVITYESHHQINQAAAS